MEAEHVGEIHLVLAQIPALLAQGQEPAKQHMMSNTACVMIPSSCARGP